MILLQDKENKQKETFIKPLKLLFQTNNREFLLGSPSGDEAPRPLCLVEAFHFVKPGRAFLLPILIASLRNRFNDKKAFEQPRSLPFSTNTYELERQRPRWLFSPPIAYGLKKICC